MGVLVVSSVSMMRCCAVGCCVVKYMAVARSSEFRGRVPSFDSAAHSDGYVSTADSMMNVESHADCSVYVGSEAGYACPKSLKKVG